MTDTDFNIKHLVDESTAGNPEPHSVSDKIREGTPGGHEEEAKPFVFAFGYMDVPGRRDELRATAGGPFAPAMEMNGMSFPPPWEKFGKSEQLAIADYIDPDKSAVARARLNDILWEKRHGDEPHLYARAAIEGYLDLLAESDWADVRKSDAISRAVELADQLNDAELIERTINAAIKHSDEAIDDTSRWNPGVPMFAMRELVGLDRPIRPTDDLVGLVDKALKRYGEDPWIRDELNQMSITLGADPRELDEASVRGFIRMADAASGLTRLLFLQKAYEKAANTGLVELREEVGLLIQDTELGPDDFGVVSASFTVTKDEFDAALKPFLAAHDIGQAIRLLALFVIPSETPEETKEAIEREHADHPFSTLITKIHLGPGNGIEIAPPDPELRKLDDETARRALGLGIRGIFAAEAISRITERFAGYSSDDLAAAFTSPLVSQSWAVKFARAFELFDEGKYDDSVHVAIPRIEGVMRDLARDLGIRTSRVAPDPKAGEEVTLGAIVSKLAGRIDEGLRLELKAALTDKRGKNLRNVVSHALANDFSREDAAIVLAIAALLATFTVRNSSSDNK